MPGYVSKGFKNLNIIVSENIVSSLTNKKNFATWFQVFLMKTAQSIHLKRRPMKRYLNPNSATLPALLKDTLIIIQRS